MPAWQLDRLRLSKGAVLVCLRSSDRICADDQHAQMMPLLLQLTLNQPMPSLMARDHNRGIFS
jgi:hypothetical protein